MKGIFLIFFQTTQTAHWWCQFCSEKINLFFVHLNMMKRKQIIQSKQMNLVQNVFSLEISCCWADLKKIREILITLTISSFFGMKHYIMALREFLELNHPRRILWEKSWENIVFYFFWENRIDYFSWWHISPVTTNIYWPEFLKQE